MKDKLDPNANLMITIPLRLQQTGVVLVLSLVLLLVTTMLGISVMNASSSQSSIARNNQSKQLSFQNAETTIAIGESEWNVVVNHCLTRPTCSVNHLPPVITQPMDWESPPVGTPFYTVEEYHGEYVVEYLGFRLIPGETNTLHFYRLTARAEDGTASSGLTLLQTIFRKCLNKDGLPCYA